MRKTYLLILLAILLTACLGVDQGNPVAVANGIEIYAPWARSAKTGEVTGAFLTIANTGTATDHLLGASSKAAQTVEVHETSMKDGVMSMREVPAIEIPAGQMLELRPGSYHIMLINLARDLADGDEIQIILHFETAGDIPVTVKVGMP